MQDYRLEVDKQFSQSPPQLLLLRRLVEEGMKGEKSEAHIIYSGEGYVRSPNYQGDKPVPEASNYNRYDYKEDYYKGMCGDDYIIDLIIPE